MSDRLIAGKYRMGYYVTQQKKRKTLLVLVVCLIIASMIIYKFHDEEYWVAKSFTFNGVQSFICIVLTVLLLWGFTWADEKLHPNSHGWLERVVWKSNYIPSLENLSRPVVRCEAHSGPFFLAPFLSLCYNRIQSYTTKRGIK